MKGNFAILTLGCKVNQYETFAIAEIMENLGYQIINSYVEDDDLTYIHPKTDIFIINTCTVTGISDRKSRQMIRRVKKVNPDCILAVMGCYSQVAPEIISNIPEVDIIWGTSNRRELPLEIDNMFMKKTILRGKQLTGNMQHVREYENLSVSRFADKTRAYIKIEDGCDRFCTYCMIPFARGPVASRKIDDIVSETKQLAENGYKEIVVIGINLGEYGKDTKTELYDVIMAMSAVEGIERIRFGSLEPDMVNDKFLDMIRDCTKLCRHFHLSVQSGCTATLSRMKRRYTAEEYANYVKQIREIVPDAAITTDYMVGFPGETDEEFEESLEFVRKINFAALHVFKYSMRKGTVAATMKQVDSSVKDTRSELLIRAGIECSKAFHGSLIGKVVKVLVERECKDRSGYYEGYTDNYVRVVFLTDSQIVNKIVSVKITGADAFYCEGLLQ